MADSALMPISKDEMDAADMDDGMDGPLFAN
jgi:hypothetical protein